MDEIIEIGKEDADVKDDWYGWVYRCPKCEELGIWNDFNYCPMCGIKLKWKSHLTN